MGRRRRWRGRYALAARAGGFWKSVGAAVHRLTVGERPRAAGTAGLTYFEARGPKDLLEPWRCVQAGGAGTLWTRGGAARGLAPRRFRNRPQGTRRSGNFKI